MNSKSNSTNNFIYFNKPIETTSNNPVACNYVKIKNIWENTPVPHQQTLQGKEIEEMCVPNFQSTMYVPGFGLNYCNSQNKPVHLNFNEKSDCYSDRQCQNKMENCVLPIM